MKRALLVLAVLLAGCLGPPAPDADPVPSDPVVDEERPEPTFNELTAEQLGGLAGADVNATLLEPPQLRAGEWWRIELTDGFSGETTQFVRVVARVEEDLYVIGMPHEGWWKEAVIFHTPAFGDVNKDLSHHAHDVAFTPLVFPLADGATWETAWENPAPITATVAVESDTVARITFTGTNCGPLGLVGQCPQPQEGVVAELVYDATIHEVREAVFPSHTWKVVEHGYGFEGWITVPRAEHLVFFHGRLGAPAFDVINTAPATPTDSVIVEGGYNRVSFILANGNVLPPGQGGAYSEKATAPDGTVYELSQIPGGPFTVEFFEHANPDGEWALEHLVAGPGFGFVEGIAYHQYDIHVPTQRVRTDHSHTVVR